MFALNDILDTPPFSLDRAHKAALYRDALGQLTAQHYAACEPYRRLLDVLHYDVQQPHAVEDIPFLPVRLFKEYDLLSVPREAVVKTMTSSGTSGQRVSKIFLDRDTSTNQTKVLTKIVADFIGKKRLPMLVIDSRAVIKDRNLFSARGAGILGFSMFGQDVTYALDEQMQLDLPTVQAFLEKHQGSPILLFGFTFMIWQHFYSALQSSGVRLPLEQGIMIHGGGWKKLIDSAVDSTTFKQRLQEVCGITRVYNYYGMVEQTGSIFMECEAGHLHASIFSDIIIRDHRDFSPLPHGQPGLVQLLSLLPSSYPGHSLLSEDLGQIIGEDDCACGRKGKYFMLHGRIKSAEVRGCSDAYAAGA
ncbi:acyl-protein synthetase [Pseudoduganella sp. FT93W]|uniref:Acyl-protein synthetase n=1 Tax=Duganella fentianensis TaxID=2692177 RepID=A0A845HXZ5_9BURK|nr:acyl-protein synthetase [Duganella fentianensis]